MNPWVFWAYVGAQTIVNLIILMSFDDHSTRLVKLETTERLRMMPGNLR